jgi:hypothetical protein
MADRNKYDLTNHVDGRTGVETDWPAITPSTWNSLHQFIPYGVAHPDAQWDIRIVTRVTFFAALPFWYRPATPSPPQARPVRLYISTSEWPLFD